MDKTPKPLGGIVRVGWVAVATVLLIALTSGAAAAKGRSGSLDRSFGVHGMETRVVNPDPEGPLHAFQIAPTPGGGVFVLAWRALLRFGPDGRLDPGFGENGQVTVGESSGSEFEPVAIAVDSQGRVLVAGTTSPSPKRGMLSPQAYANGPPQESATVYRFSSRGKPDPSFGTDGVVSSTLGLQPPTFTPIEASGEAFHYEAPAVHVTGLAVDSEDRPILTGIAATEVGSCRDSWYVPFHETFVARMTANGALDPTFSGTGVRANAAQFSAGSPIIDPLGGVVYRRSVGSECEPDISAITGVGRLNADGAADPGLGPDEMGKFPSARAIAVDRSGRILLLRGGIRYETPKVQVVRLHPNGTLDTSFGRNGTTTVRLAEGTTFSAIAVDSHGRVLLAGTHGKEDAHESFELLRLRSNGKVDRHFGRQGRVLTSLGWVEGWDIQVTADRQGRLLVGGWLEPTGHRKAKIRFALARYLP